MTLTTRSAYEKGWAASQHAGTTGNYPDMDAAESRFVTRYGTEFQDYWNQGWTDQAAGYPKWSSYRQGEDVLTRQQALAYLNRAQAGLRWAREALDAENTDDLAEAMVEVIGSASAIQEAVENDALVDWE